MAPPLIRLRKAAGRLARRLPVTARIMAERRRRTRTHLLERIPAGGRAAEIGVWRGDFSQMILDIARPSELHLVDPWAFIDDAPYAWEGGKVAGDQGSMDALYRSVAARFADRPEVILHRSTSTEAATTFEPESLDWVYVDGDHRYEFVAADLAHYVPIVRRNGFVVGDDYYWGPDKGLPVKRAVTECIASGSVELVAILDSQFILRRR
jgi:hypothetical protein